MPCVEWPELFNIFVFFLSFKNNIYIYIQICFRQKFLHVNNYWLLSVIFFYLIITCCRFTISFPGYPARFPCRHPDHPATPTLKKQAARTAPQVSNNNPRPKPTLPELEGGGRSLDSQFRMGVINLGRQGLEGKALNICGKERQPAPMAEATKVKMPEGIRETHRDTHGHVWKLSFHDDLCWFG